MGLFLVLAHPVLLALVTSIVVFFGAAWALGTFRTERVEARTGIKLLCAMRWNEYTRLVSDLLKDRGLQPSNTDRPPGKDGFDLLFTRGNGRYLVQCANAANREVSATTVGQLYTLVQMQGADGAIIASCGRAEPAALKLAQERRIEVLAGRDLWAHLKPWVAHDQLMDAEAAAATAKRQRLLGAALTALLAGIVAWFVGDALRADAPPASPAPTVTPTASPARAGKPATGSAPGKAGGEAATKLPDASLTAEQLASRRASAVLEVRSLSRVSVASWTSQSTLEVAMHAVLDDQELTKLVNNICDSLLQYEELRFTRLQLEVPTGNPEQATQVRWRQCR